MHEQLFSGARFCFESSSTALLGVCRGTSEPWLLTTMSCAGSFIEKRTRLHFTGLYSQTLVGFVSKYVWTVAVDAYNVQAFS